MRLNRRFETLLCLENKRQGGIMVIILSEQLFHVNLMEKEHMLDTLIYMSLSHCFLAK